MKKINIDRKARKNIKVRSKIFGTSVRPRIAVYRSNKYIYGQAIDDVKGQTIASFSSLNIDKKNKEVARKAEEAKLVGGELGKILRDKKIKSAIFDRGYYGYLGRVKNFCDGLRESGIKI